MANTISLNKDAIANNNSTIEEAILMLSIHNNLDFSEAEKSLISKGLITADRDDNYQPIGWRLTRSGQQLLESIILDSDKHKQPEERIASLAESLMEVFPKLKKSGTSSVGGEKLGIGGGRGASGQRTGQKKGEQLVRQPYGIAKWRKPSADQLDGAARVEHPNRHKKSHQRG